MTKNDVEAVRRALASFQAVANDPSSAEFWERHREFHWALLAPSANATVKRVLDHLWQSSERYVRLFVSTFATMDTVMDLHVELCEACAGGDVSTFKTRSLGTTWKRSKPFATDLERFRLVKSRLLIHFSGQWQPVFAKRKGMSGFVQVFGRRR